MEAVEVKVEDILSCEEIPIVRLNPMQLMPSSGVIKFTRKIGPLPSEMSYRALWNQQIN